MILYFVLLYFICRQLSYTLLQNEAILNIDSMFVENLFFPAESTFLNLLILFLTFHFWPCKYKNEHA